MSFSPIAIVGQGCVLPGALNPEEYWELLRSGRTAIRPAEPGSWRLDHSRMITANPNQIERAVSDHGGYISGFESSFDAHGFAMNASDVLRQEPVVQWLLESGRQALTCSRSEIAPGRQAIIIGNLGYPTTAQSQHAELVWLRDNGFEAGATQEPLVSSPDTNFAKIVARGLGMDGDAFMIDAACASSIYAIHLACRALQDGDADFALAGGSNNSDDLFLHVGFTALRALSPSGYCQPFSNDADGLIPAHGAALVALKRLEDAVRAGDSILGIIRGIGLSNDGRAGGFLSPSREGQVRALRAAYQSAGLKPDDIQYVECHATGTNVGDGIELSALNEIFANTDQIRIGSHKGNIGHAITAAGAAGLVKLLGMFRYQAFVPSVTTNFRGEANSKPLLACDNYVSWQTRGPRRAGLSAFGFGGANAHLIVEEPPARAPSTDFHRFVPDLRKGADSSDAATEIAIVGACVLTSSSRSWTEFVASLTSPIAEGESRAIRSFTLADAGFPPRDLAMTLPQQLAFLSAVDTSVSGIDLPNNRTAVFVGTDVENEISRYGARMRLPELMRHIPGADEEWIRHAQQTIVSPLEAAGVTGTMPNIVAHRVNLKHDFQGPGYTVSEGTYSGIRALQMAIAGLRHKDFDAAIVGAVDLCSEAVHEASTRSTLDGNPQGDAVVAFVLKRCGDAELAKNPILGTINVVTSTRETAGASDVHLDVMKRFGHCGAAAGLLEVAVNCAKATTQKSMQTGHAEFRTERANTFQVEFHPVLERMENWLEGRTVVNKQSTTFAAHPPRVVFPGLQSINLSKTQPASVEMETNGGKHLISPLSGQNRILASQLHEKFIRELASSHQLFLANRSHAIRELLSRRQSPSTGNREYVKPVLPANGAAAEVLTQSSPLPSATLARPIVQPSGSASTPRDATERRIPTGPQFSRLQLEVLAGGRISEVLGPLFRQQDAFRRQVRLPMPPLLLADRVVGIDAEPGKHGTGTIWTETDVRWDSWYLHQGVMPAGFMIESGQADLLLISWMGADFLNRDERVYRLLGCEATFFGGLPRPGETLHYQITIDGHARQGDVRLFFFHYDCYVNGVVRLQVRHGQAGFFTNEELKNTDGVLWSPESRDLGDGTLGPPAIDCSFKQFTRQQIDAFYEGKLLACFGAGFEQLQTHSRSPQIAGTGLKLIDQINSFDPTGGPWKRGYLSAQLGIDPNDWFFAGHFLNDPCMPGTLMLEACLHAMSFYLTALGLTAKHDGWQFEPVADVPVTMQCRGQVTPESKLLSIEILVEEVISGPEPTLFADLLCTVDGVKAYYARRMGLRLVPSWPITSRPTVEADGTGICRADVRGDYAAFLECAWGRPSVAFGPKYAPFDRFRRTPRLPGPPYHFISRATRIDAEPGQSQPGSEVEVEYDIPRDAWYFDDTQQPTMPISVLMEVNLQPCGWLAMMAGVVLRTQHDLFFRNLDGNCTVFQEVTPQTGRLTTRARLLRSSTVGDTTIVFFGISCFADGRTIVKMETSFGFFTSRSLAQQVGLPDEPKPIANNLVQYDHVWNDSATVPMLRMSDRIHEYSTSGGRHGRGCIYADQTVDCSAWYFKAHFYQDPVQPGSLGVQALVNLLIEWLRRSHGSAFTAPHFEPIANGEQLAWTYRGQVSYSARRVQQCVDIVEVKRDTEGLVAVAQGTLWVDGMCIYRLSGLAVRIVESAERGSSGLTYERVVDPDLETWWKDHSPTYSVPAMPLMGIANELARAGQSWFRNSVVIGIHNLSLNAWLTLASPITFRFKGEVIDQAPSTGARSVRVQLFAGRGRDLKLVATGTVVLADHYAPASALHLDTSGLKQQADPYEDASLFHGPAFQLVRRLWQGTGRSLAEIDISDCSVPSDLVHPALLDAALHGVPHSDWSKWLPHIAPGQIGYPVQLDLIEFTGPVPTSGQILAEAQVIDPNPTLKTQLVQVQIIAAGHVWAKIRFQERLFPIGEFAKNPLRELRSFIRDRLYRPGIGLSRRDGSTTRLAATDVATVNWLPGTIEHIYKIPPADGNLSVHVAVREHVANDWQVHPSAVEWDPTQSIVRLSDDPQRFQRLCVTCDGPIVTVRSV